MPPTPAAHESSTSKADTAKTLRSDGRSRAGTLLIIAAAYVAVGANIQGFRALLPAVLEDFTISRGQVGLYASFFFLSATAAAILAGNIIDRMGAKAGLFAGVSCVGVIMALHAAAPAYAALVALGFAAGAGFSLITPAVNLAVMESVSGKHRAMYMGIAHSGGGTGGFLGATLMPLAAAALGWRGAVVVSGVFALLMGFVIYGFYQGRPPTLDKGGVERTTFRELVRSLADDKRLLYVGLFGFTMGTAMSAISTHFALYLHQDLGLSETWAGLGLGALLLGGVIGPPTCGWASDTLLNGNRRRGLILLGTGIGTLCLVFGTLVAAVRLPLPVLLVLSVILGAICFSGPGLYFTAVSELSSRGRTGVSTGLALIFARVGIVASPPLFGILADLTQSYRVSWLALAALVLLLIGIYSALSNTQRQASSAP